MHTRTRRLLSCAGKDIHPDTFLRARGLGEDERTGVLPLLLEALRLHPEDEKFVSELCFTLKHVAVNDVICA